ncbi:MAG: hypothetical protein K1X28_03245 [Parachlamydiales bacterium]|nr:hypothetical protein [Parachlamydiales bacterium]
MTHSLPPSAPSPQRPARLELKRTSSAASEDEKPSSASKRLKISAHVYSPNRSAFSSPVRVQSAPKREISILQSPTTDLVHSFSGQKIFSPLSDRMDVDQKGFFEEGTVVRLPSQTRSLFQEDFSLPPSKSGSSGEQFPALSPPPLLPPPVSLVQEGLSFPPSKSGVSGEQAFTPSSMGSNGHLTLNISTPSPSSGEPSKSGKSLAAPSPFNFLGSPSPVARDSLLKEFGVKLELLCLIDSDDPASVLAATLLNRLGAKDLEDQALICIHEFVNMIKEQPHKFHDEVKKLKVNQRHFANPVEDIKSRTLALQLLLGWLHKVNPKEAEKIFADDFVYLLVKQKFEFDVFPVLQDNDNMNLHNCLKDGISDPRTRAMSMDIIPKAYAQGKIDLKNIEEYCDLLFSHIAYQGTRMICLLENKGLLVQTDKMLKQLLSVCNFQDVLDIQNLLHRFQAMFYLDPNHLSEAQYRNGSLVGLHEYPQHGRGSYAGEKSHIEAVVRYPRLETETASMAPVSATIKTSKDDFQQKISTFSKVCPTLDKQIRAIDQVLQNPINDASQDPEESRRYIGLENGEARVVYTNKNRTIGTSFVLPFFEVRSHDPKKEQRVIPTLEVIDEEGGKIRRIEKPFSPQTSMFQYIARRRAKAVQSPSLSKRRLSNQDLGQVNQSMRDLLSEEDSPFKIIPTGDDRVLVEMPLSACDISMQKLFTCGYKSSGRPTGQTKRLAKEEIGDVFDDEANGITVILMYQNMTEFTKAFMNFSSSTEGRK